MRYTQLKAFHNVALHGGFSRASKVMLRAQPAISEHVRRLEQDHDTLLFHREKKGVRLTEDGKQLFKLTKHFFEVEEQVSDFLSAKQSVVGGTLRIIVDSVSHISGTLSRFRSTYPDVFVSVRTGNTEDMVSELRAYNAELIVCGSLDPGSDLETVPLGSTPIIAFAAKDYLPNNKTSLTLEELRHFPLVFREQGSKTRKQLEDTGIARNTPLNPAIEVEGREALREVVASGAGIGFVSDAEFGNDSRLVRIPVDDIDIRMDECVVYLAQRRELRIIHEFVEFIKTDKQLNQAATH